LILRQTVQRAVRPGRFFTAGKLCSPGCEIRRWT
jgi:hypothetical protein